jgi:hypothetical protein
MRKIAATATLLTLLLPTLLSAAPKNPPRSQAAPSAKQLLVSWFHTLLDHLTPTTSKPLPEPTNDGRCGVDPNGGTCTP